jgi:cytochrome P450
MPLFINYYLLKFDRRYQKALKTLENYAEKIIQKYQEEIHSDGRPVNLIASLVSSLQKDEGIERQKSEEEKIGITKKELLDEVLTLILGGFETTSTIISWFIYYASKNPEIQQKMKEELKENGITKETFSDDIDLLNQCEYIDCVIKETLRITPLTVGSFRTLTDHAIIDGIPLRKGETVITAFALMQNDPRNWKLDPKLFLPERFYGNDASDINHNPFAFAPFGGGHRICAGQDLARLELKVIISRLMLRVTFVDAPGNNGGHNQRATVMPKELAVYIKFD